MKHIVLVALPLIGLGLTTPALAADLGPGYERPGYEEGAVVEWPARRVVERERIIERRYVEPREEIIVEPRRVYVEPRVYYEPAPYAVIDRPYAHGGYGAYWRRGGHWRHAGWRHHGHRW